MLRESEKESSEPMPLRMQLFSGRVAAPANPAPAAPEAATSAALPAEAEFILSALEAGQHAGSIHERRAASRVRFSGVIRLTLFSDGPDSKPWALFARDASMRGMGFITRHRLPLGYGGTVRFRGPANEEVTADITINRCRESVSGWFEGSLTFNREQWCFEKK